MVIGLSVLLFGAGAWTARQMPIDVFPDLTAPTVTILTEGHGMAPEEMESLVTFPLESAINGASGVRRVRSATAVGIAVVWVEFDWGTDIFMARQVVAEKLALVSGTLPPQVERPVLAPISSIMGEILFFAISSDARRSADAADDRRHDVRRRLLAVPGVSQVTPIGGAERQYQVIAHPDRAAREQRVADRAPVAVRGASQNTSAGVYTEGPQEYVLEAVGRVANARGDRRDAWSRLRGDRSVLVEDVADVREGAAFKRGEGSRSGKPAVIVGVQKQPGANTIELTRAARSRARHAAARAARGHDHRSADLPAGRLHRSGGGERVRALRDGGILVVVIVVLFLANMRAGAITLTAMPLSLAAAILVLRAFGASINTMTLGGMAIAIGALGGRCDHRRGERRPAAARESRQAGRPSSSPAADDRARCDAGDPDVDRVRDRHHRACLPADLRPDGHRRPAAHAARLCLHRRAARVAGRGDRRHAGAVLTHSYRMPRRSSAATTDGWRGAEARLRARAAARAGPSVRGCGTSRSRCCSSRRSPD